MPPKNGYTDRGGAEKQDKNWTKFDLAQQTRFIHCGSAPLASKGGEGLLLKYSKETVTVAGYKDAPTKFILAFPLLGFPPGMALPDPIDIAKPCQLLWDFDEMPNVFVFTLDAGKEVWSEGAVLDAKKEVGMAFDVIWKEALVGEYVRKNKARADLVK
jgi:hypothetical protein